MFLVSIPQAISAVATSFPIQRYLEYNEVSIPRAVSAVATIDFAPKDILTEVSIPRAVSAVATAGSRKPVFKRFQKVVLESLKP